MGDVLSDYRNSDHQFVTMIMPWTDIPLVPGERVSLYRAVTVDLLLMIFLLLLMLTDLLFCFIFWTTFFFVFMTSVSKSVIQLSGIRPLIAFFLLRSSAHVLTCCAMATTIFYIDQTFIRKLYIAHHYPFNPFLLPLFVEDFAWAVDNILIRNSRVAVESYSFQPLYKLIWLEYQIDMTYIHTLLT